MSSVVASPALVQQSDPSLGRRRRVARLFRWLCMGVTWMSVVLLVVLIFHILRQGITWIDWQFLSSLPSRFAERAGLKGALFGSLWLIGLTVLISVPTGMAAAIYLEEYGSKSRLQRFIDVNIANLAGVPSIVYGILGLAVFVRGIGLEASLLSGALTMSLLILPVVIIASREALRAVPDSLRQGAFALGATRWQTIRHHVLPAALPGILTGVILAISRAIGETAPLIMVGAAAYVNFVPDSPMSGFSALPILIYEWAKDPREEFQELAAAGIIVLLVVLLLLNSIAIITRNLSQKKVVS